MHPSRLFGLAAVLFKGVCAGTIDSSSGNATVTPAPQRNVRRERCFLVMNMVLVSRLIFPAVCAVSDRASFVSDRDTSNLKRKTRGGTPRLQFFLHFHLERCAFHNPENKRRETIVVACCIPGD